MKKNLSREDVINKIRVYQIQDLTTVTTENSVTLKTIHNKFIKA